jgi:O-Antigen ligase
MYYSAMLTMVSRPPARTRTGQSDYGHLGPLRVASVAFLCVGVITSSWNGLRAGAGIALCDVFFVLATFSWIAATISRHAQVTIVPRWLLVPAYVLLVDVFLSALATGGSTASMLPGIRLAVALLLTPLVVGLIAGNCGALWLVTDCWLLSAGVNAGVGVSDYFAHTRLGYDLTGGLNLGRVAGLTTAPNHLAFVCVLALPILVVRMLQRPDRKLKLACAATSVVTILGLLASGSRAGILGGVFVLVSIPLFQPSIRSKAVKVLAVGLVAVAVVAMVVPSGLSVVSIQRLTGASSQHAGVEASDSERRAAAQVALRQFRSSPIYGVGFSDITEAHDVYLQLLSAGGVIALVAWLAFSSGAVLSSGRFARMTQVASDVRGLAGAVCGTLVAWLLMGAVENQLYDRYLFVPCGLFVGCLVVVQRARIASVRLGADGAIRGRVATAG